ncbi:MAG: glycosyltransferase family 2 protein [Candidatus Omnitrophota bacterium]
MNDTCVIIPAYNEEKVIASLIERIKNIGLTVVVVDDGSSDATADMAQAKGAVVLKSEKNQGKGSALRRGFEYALKSQYQTIVTLDADGQHNPESIKDFIQMRKKTNADMVVGNRMRNTENMPLARIITNRFMSWLISRASGQNIPDTQCGFRLIQKIVLENITLLAARYDMESEILIEAAKKGYKIESLPIETIYQGEKSQIHPVLDTLRFIKTYLRLLFTKKEQHGFR